MDNIIRKDIRNIVKEVSGILSVLSVLIDSGAEYGDKEAKGISSMMGYCADLISGIPDMLEERS